MVNHTELKRLSEAENTSAPTRADLITSRDALFTALVDIVEEGAGYPQNRVAARLTLLAMKGLHADPLAKVLPVIPPEDTGKTKIFGRVDKPNHGG